MMYTAYSSIHTHVSSLIPQMMCRIIMVLLGVMYDPHSLFIYHTHVSSLIPRMMCRIIMVLPGVMYDLHSLFIYSHMCL